MIEIKFIDEPYSKYRRGKTIKYKSFKELLKLENFDNIKFIYCQYCQLKSEDLKILPKELLVLDCEHNNITEFINLPEKLRILRCRNNNIDKLPKLPDSLIILDCDVYLKNRCENYYKTKKKVYDIYRIPKIYKEMELKNLSFS